MGLQRELEITVLSATNLKRRYCLGTTNASYAVLWIDSHSKAPTHVADRSALGSNVSWNSVIRLLCRESLFGSAAKAKLVIQVFDSRSKLKVAGTGSVLLSDLQLHLVRGSCPGESWSEPKRMTLDIRRLRAGSYQKEKVIGSVDIQVRVGRAAVNRIAEGSAGSVIYYNDSPIQLERNEFVPRNFEDFEEKCPAPLLRQAEKGEASPVYYQHAAVEKPKVVWKGINDDPKNVSLGAFALAVLV